MVRKTLILFKEKILELENNATVETSTNVLSVIKEISKYISVHVKLSKVKDEGFEKLQILYNYVTTMDKDGNDTAMIVVKENISTIIDSLLEQEAVSLPGEKYDVFISHASKDKIGYVNALRSEIKKLGVEVFYDKDIIEWGDNWKETILDATARCEFAIVVISENFFGREWTERELSEFLHRQNDTTQKIVLPLLYNVSPKEVINRYPFLEDIQYIETSKYTKKEIAILFAKQYIKRIKSKIKY